MFTSPAWAQAAAGGNGFSDMLPQIMMMGAIFAVFYFLLIRPQQRKSKEHKEMLGKLRRGDRVVTGGGIIATVVKVVDDNEVLVEIADGVRSRIVRSTITGVLARSEPAKDDKEEQAEEKPKVRAAGGK
jgi:preprotein translocase subunit YajC